VCYNLIGREHAVHAGIPIVDETDAAGVLPFLSSTHVWIVQNCLTEFA
jgi:hypothetical protein